MLQEKWKHFKSGTDIRGVALEGVEGQTMDLTDEAVTAMASGFVMWLCNRVKKNSQELTIAVGRDSRLSGPRLRDAVCEAMKKMGVHVLDCGLASTPAMFMTTVDLACDGSVQLTASHHPFYRNGLKFFTRAGGLEGNDIEAILTFAQDNRFEDAEGGRVESVNYMATYAAHLRKMICEGVKAQDYEQPLKGFHIVVDAGNGAGGFYATDVLQPLGADISGSQFLNPDGRFPNHIPNPEDGEAMESVCSATKAAGADLGVIFDTDVDRAGCVDSEGREINRNRLIALASCIALEDHAGGTIVTDSVTSDGLKAFIQNNLGGVHCRFIRGYKNVINEAIRLNEMGSDAPLAIETSGHAALKENYFLDDGAYLVTKIIIKAASLRACGSDLAALIEKLEEPAECTELRFTITEPDFKAYGNRVIDGLEKYAAEKGWAIADDSHEGIRISFDKDHGDGWLLLRLSVHDPVMPLNIESNTPGGCKQIAGYLQDYLRSYDHLTVKALTEYLA